MTKGRILGCVMTALLCGASAASAQGYYRDAYDQPTYYGNPSETIIVHPNDVIEEQQMVGHINGEVDPQLYRISRPVNFSDLNLSNGADRAALHDRIFQTASDLCAELDARVPGLAGDASADRECVREATRNAMRDAMDRYYYG